MFKKLSAIILSVLITLPVLPVSAFASYADGADSGYVGDLHIEFVENDDGSVTKMVYDDNGNPVDTQRDTLQSASVTLPSSYDARTTDRVTSVKSQSPFGSCWTFAFCSAAESSLVSQGYETKDSVDLSEAHLAWFRAANYVEGSSNPVQQDRRVLSESTFNAGGNCYDAAATVARWSGLTTETKYPYLKTESDMQFPSSAMFVNDYNLTSMKIYSAETDTDLIKQAIINNGAIATSLYYDTNAIMTSSEGCTHYQSTKTSTNHAITCVGWDDNFSKSNFKTTPPGDGAWLIKNSWGTSMNTQGYFWLSYYDTSIDEFSEINVKPAGDYDNNYQYDGCFVTSATSYGSTTYGANIFTANGSEKVKGCGFWTFDNTALTCTAMLYTGLTDASKPTSGNLRESKSISVSNQGYYTIDFNNAYSISEGEKFAVVIKYYSSSGGSAYLPYESNSGSSYSYTASSGQSFYGYNGSTWSDMASSSRGNIPIKAFTVDSNAPSVSSISIIQNPLKLEYFQGQSIDFTGLSVRAFYSDGSSAVIPFEDLSVSGYNSSTVGTQTITVSYGGKTATFSVTVTAVVATGIEIYSLPNKTQYFVGDTYDFSGLKIRVLYNDGTEAIKSGGFRISYYDSSSAGTKNITVIYGDFTATFTFTVIKVAIDSIAISTYPTKTSYYVGETADYSGLTLTAYYNNGTTQTVTSGYTCTGFDSSVAGTKIITVTYSGKTAEFEITVLPVHGILPSDDSEIETVIDYDKMLVCIPYRTPDGIDGFVSAKDGYTYSCNSFGTGSKLYVYKNGELAETYELVVNGDVNGDIWADGTDAMTVKLIVNGMLTREQVGEAAYMAADCNHDGVIDGIDAEILEQAGVLLADVDRTQSTEELESSSAYQEYINLMGHAFETETEETVESVQIVEPTDNETNFFDILIDIFVRIFNYIKLQLAILK